MNNGLLEHLKAFVAIAHSQSVTAASIATNVSQATLSRQLAALERHLGCRLLSRSTRAMSLTQEGAIYLRHAERMLELNEAAEDALQESKGKLRGRLRVGCSNAFARRILLPLIKEWQQLHPHLSLDIVISDQLAHLIEDQIDVAFRLAPVEEMNLIARPIGLSRRVVVASREYLRAHPPITEPADLRRHDCILFSGLERPHIWRFESAKGMQTVRVSGRLSMSSVDAMHEAVLDDLGVAITPSWFWTPADYKHRIVQILPTFRLQEQTINAVMAARTGSAAKVKRFINHVAAALSRSAHQSGGAHPGISTEFSG